ncbi:beta-glucosidase [Blautia obeum]|uniref:Beta-glucosidase n=1 Tax=Blautia obeum TaxID=40520 RepID=A0A454HG40_9FIRM|nr:glycoside hydrolase family 3 protein [Blautia obeum]RGY05654.1 beta-glucosidase [Blautia obeum]RHC05688.1 beta-glucosidase [Blautia obeum]
MRTIKTRHFTGTTDNTVMKRELDNRKIARRAAAEGMVLLKNEGQLLPLKEGTKVALYGVGASRTIKGGTGSGDVNERETVSIYQGMKNAGFEITTEDWIKAYDEQYQAARYTWRDEIEEKASSLEDQVLGFFNVYSTTPFRMPAGAAITQTDADVAIYILSRVAGEGADRFDAEGDYYLTKEEKQQLSDICSMYKHVIVAVNTGGLADLSFMDEYSNIEALLQIVQPGMEAGNAFADIISGKVTPSGKMTDTWAYKYEDYPNSKTFSHNNGNVDKEYYTEGLYVGYRYFDSFDIPVRYGFGYGLSYTTFETKVLATELKENKKIVIETEVTNTGDTYSGKEVVELYATCPAGKLEKEYRRLVAFAKTGLLAPGQCEKLTLEIGLDKLTSYSEKEAAWILEKGTYVIWAGNSLEASAPCAVLNLDKEVVLTKTQNICPLKEELEEMKQSSEKMNQKLEALLKTAEELPVMELKAADVETRVVEYRSNVECVPEEARKFVDTLSKEKLVALASGDPGKGQGSNLGSAGISVPGSAGETNNCALEDGVPGIVLADGPAGLRLMKHYNVHEGKIVNKPFKFSLEGGLFCEGEPADPGETYYQYCTAIPVGTLLAQTWDTALIEEIGEMIGGEMLEFSVTLWLAPGMNIHRNPLCGRNFEYYSEDPLLAGRMAGAMTNGVQNVPGCGTTIKHFACNNQEDNRMGSDSILSERTLREIYLKGFEIAITESQPMSIMTSYNLINGVHAANCEDTCTKAARCEWGFQGVIMTDWTTTEYGPDCTASGCMRAGNDLVMPGAFSDRDNLNQELADGTLSMEDLKACISRLVNITWQSMEFEDAAPYKKVK